MPQAGPTARQACWVALFFALLTIWVRPGPTTLYGIDAGCYARVAAEMAAQPWAHWADVQLGGAGFYEHPPGFVLIEAAAFRFFGDHTRVAVALARGMATCALLLMGLIAHAVAGERAVLGTWVALPAISSFLFESQNPMLEMPLCVGLLLAMLGAWILPRQGVVGTLAFAFGSAAAFWTKGPPGLAAGAWLVWASWRQRTPRARVAAAALTSSALVGITVAAFEWQRARLGLAPFFSTYFDHQVVASAIHGRHNPQGSPWYYFPVIWRWHATGVVWAIPILLALGQAPSRHRSAVRLAEMGVVWSVVWVLGFSIMRQKYQWYMHPITPAFAWIAGAGAAAWGPWPLHWRKIGLRAQCALPLVYSVLLLCYPSPFRTPHLVLDALHATPRPSFAAGDARVVAYCGPHDWREQHVARFLWRADLTHCDATAPYRFDGETLTRIVPNP